MYWGRVAIREKEGLEPTCRDHACNRLPQPAMLYLEGQWDLFRV